MSNIYLIRGNIGSGKSTFARSLGCFHLEADMYFIEDGKYTFDRMEIKYAHILCQALAEKIMYAGPDLAISNTFTEFWELEAYFDLASTYNYNIIIYRCTGNYGNLHGAGQDVYNRMKNRFVDFEGEIYV